MTVDTGRALAGRVCRLEYCIRRAIADLIDQAETDIASARPACFAACRALDVAKDLLGALDKLEAAETSAGYDALANALVDIRGLAGFAKREIAARAVEEAMNIVVELVARLAGVKGEEP